MNEALIEFDLLESDCDKIRGVDGFIEKLSVSSARREFDGVEDTPEISWTFTSETGKPLSPLFPSDFI